MRAAKTRKSKGESPRALEVARPRALGFRAWWRILLRVAAEADSRNLGLIAAGVAFYTLLSIFPAIAALVALWGVFADPQTIADQLGMAQQLLPEAAYGIVERQVDTLVSSAGTTLQLTGIVSILLAVWTARNGVASMIRGLNAAYREHHRSSTIKRYLVAIGLTVLLIGVAIIAFAAVIMVPIILNFLTLPFGIEALISALKWVILLGVVLFSIGLVYRHGPNRRSARVRWLSPGALFALVTWAAGSFAFSLYLRNFGALNEVYVSIGAVIALLLWFFLSAYVVLIGALLNAEIELETIRDTTVGSPRPAGERKAYVADHVVDSDGNVHVATQADADDAQT